jgi:hypothetical protein|tara:strand:- start:335 stop:538 length:204 start_codon:yes stop_codon:yes gene_type:complete
MFDLDKEVAKIAKMQKLELKKRKEEVKFTRSRLDDALSLAMLKLALDMNQRTKKEAKDERRKEDNNH